MPTGHPSWATRSSPLWSHWGLAASSAGSRQRSVCAAASHAKRTGGQQRGAFGNGHLQLGPPRTAPWVSSAFIANPLIEQAGGLALDWYDGDNPLEAFYDLQKDYRKKNNAQTQDFDVPVNEIVDIVLVALGRRAPSELTKFEWR